METSSKFPLRINGALLVTSIFNGGDTDNFNLPIVALPKLQYNPQGSLSATASQTMLAMSTQFAWSAESRSRSTRSSSCRRTPTSSFAVA